MDRATKTAFREIAVILIENSFGEHSTKAASTSPLSDAARLQAIESLSVTELWREYRRIKDEERFRRQKARRFPPGAHLLGGQRAALVNQELANKFYSAIIPIVAELRERGLSLRAIAWELDGHGIECRNHRHGQKWHPMQVARVLRRQANSRK